MIVSFPSGPQLGNRASVRPKKTGPEKQTADARKNKYHFSTELASVCPDKNKCPKEKKGAARQPERGKAFWASPECFFLVQAGCPPRLRPGNRATVRPKKTGPETSRGRKKKSHLFLKRRSDGKLTIKFTFP